MKMNSPRAVALLAAAAAVAGLVAAIDGGDPDTVPAVAAQSLPRDRVVKASPPGEAEELDIARLFRRGPVERAADAFQARSWAPPAPLMQTTSVVAVPRGAPPLPFTYLGRYQDNGEPVIFLVRGDRILTVSAGEIIEGTYRVEGIEGSTLALTYLPLNIRQTLDVGAAG